MFQDGLNVIDLSGYNRIKDSTTYRYWYHLEPGNEAVLNEAVYGLTEWLETDLMDTRFVANPGCFPTAVLLGLAPLVKQHLIEEQSIIIDAKTGVSGARSEERRVGKESRCDKSTERSKSRARR